MHCCQGAGGLGDPAGHTHALTRTLAHTHTRAQVSVAILLENFIAASEAEEAAQRTREIREYQEEHAVQVA